jgi:hypothetical protein
VITSGKQNLFIGILSVAATAIFVYLAAYEDVQVLFPVFFSGAIANGLPLNIFNYTSHYFTAEFIIFLYRLFPGITWYEVWMSFLTALSLFIILKLFFDRFKSHYYLLIVVVLVLFFFAELTVIFQYTRTAFLVGIASLFLSYFKIYPRKCSVVLSAALLLVCTLTRWEVGIFMLIIQWLMMVIVYRGKAGRMSLAVNTFLLSVVVGFILYERLNTTDYVGVLQQELGFQLDRNNIVPLSDMTTTIDTAKYKAVLNLISDPNYITIGFIRSMIRIDMHSGVSSDLLLRALEMLWTYLLGTKGFLIVYLVTLYLVLRQRQAGNRWDFWGIVIFNLTIWLIEYLITYYIKMEFRQLNSMLIMVCLLNIAWLNPEQLSLSFWHKNGLAVLLVCGLIFQIGTMSDYRDRLLYENLQNKLFKTALDEKCEEKIVVPDLHFTQHVINYFQPFQKPDFSQFNRLYMFDFDVMYLEENYNRYLSKECHCNANDYINLMEFFRSKKDDVIFVSEPERMNSIQEYCRVVRNHHYNFNIIDSVEAGNQKAYLYAFSN